MLRAPQILIPLLFSASALAADPEGSNGQEQCESGGQTQLDLNLCAQQEFQTSDRELNRVYRAAMQSLPAESRERLRKEQRAWLESRDPDCRAEADAQAAGGSMRPMLYHLCRADATQKRTQQLRDWKP